MEVEGEMYQRRQISAHKYELKLLAKKITGKEKVVTIVSFSLQQPNRAENDGIFEVWRLVSRIDGRIVVC